MKRALYILLFAGLGVILGGIVAWSVELAYLSVLEYNTTTFINALGFGYRDFGVYDIVYIVMVAIGAGAGVLQGVRTWERVYGDRIVPLQRRRHVVLVVPYVALVMAVCALVYVTNTFGIQTLFAGTADTDEVAETQLAPSVTVSSGIHGIVYVVGRCADTATATTSGDCAAKPYQSAFAVFQNKRVVKVVESSENGEFSASLLPGEYVIGMVPGRGWNTVRIADLPVTVPEGDKVKLELRFSDRR